MAEIIFNQYLQFFTSTVFFVVPGSPPLSLAFSRDLAAFQPHQPQPYKCATQQCPAVPQKPATKIISVLLISPLLSLAFSRIHLHIPAAPTTNVQVCDATMPGNITNAGYQKIFNTSSASFQILLLACTAVFRPQQ